ncbi:hypothetical protein A6768_24885 [Sphingobium yanoikuyae]|uniref:Uncharacterized protein n=2 Tax=Sphingobium yanoikuyae TaxID=13690 RepID=A0A291N2H9_SPHYA|nr:hypothetical protein A6768_16715 [Sphingobium yanoikuyae]ATI82914.1 hypothetical protein A6768_24885 [Sphingobium yanoikuyae]
MMTMISLPLILTALALAFMLAVAAHDVREILSYLDLFRRLLPPDLPRELRALLWRQNIWLGFPVRTAIGLLFWLWMAFLLACHLAKMAMTP